MDGPSPLSSRHARILLSALKGWKLIDGKALRQEFLMKDFMAAVGFIDAIARTAQSQQHHPDLHLTGYRKLVVELSTHEAGGLTGKDFVLAVMIDTLPRKLKRSR